MARRGDPARPKNRGDVEQQHIPEAHGFAQLRFGIGRRTRNDGHLFTCGCERCFFAE